MERAFEFGIEGKKVSMDLGEKTTLDADVSDADAFFRGLSSGDMHVYLDEDLARVPRLCQRVVDIAIARHVLEGGLRDLNWDDTASIVEGEYLTIRELALLADMDERSVRNAAASKTLETEQIIKRTFVHIAEAKRWLAGRKGFVPTQGSVQAVEPGAMSPDTLKALVRKASLAGKTLDAFVLERLLAD